MSEPRDWLKDGIEHIPSSIKGFRRCARRWRFDQDDPQDSEAFRVGTEIHRQREAYLNDGILPESVVARAGLHELPPAGSAKDNIDILVERRWELRVDGLYPLFGTIDLAVLENPNLPSVQDHKTSSDIDQYGLTEKELAVDPQLNCYAYFVLIRWTPMAKRIELVHHYTQTRDHGEDGKAKSVRTIVSRQSVEAQWAAASHSAKEMYALRPLPPEASPGNPDACGDYGGCPHKMKCSVFKGEELG